MNEEEVSDIKVNEEFPFHELRYVETNKWENKSQRTYLSCILHLTNQRRVTKRYCSLESLCSDFAEVMGKLKNGGQMANDFHLYKVGIRYLINPEYLVCLHPKGEKKHVWIGHKDNPTLDFNELTDISSDTLRDFRRLLNYDEAEKQLALREAQASGRKAKREQYEKEESTRRMYQNVYGDRHYSSQLVGFLVKKDSDEPSYYRPEDFNDDVCVI